MSLEERERSSHLEDSSDTVRPSSPSSSNFLLPNETVYSDVPSNSSTATSAAHLGPSTQAIIQEFDIIDGS